MMNEVNVLAEAAEENFITDLIQRFPVSKVKVSRAGFSVRSGSKIIDLENVQTVVDGPNVMGLFDGMSRRNKRLVTNTYRFADIMAKNMYPGNSQRVQRFNYLLEILGKLKWTVITSNSKAYEKQSSSFTMENVLIDIVGGIVKGVAGATGIVPLVTSTLGALKTDEKALTVFERAVEKDTGRRFGMAACKEDKDGDVYMALTVVNYSAEPGNDGGVLFFKWKSSEIEFLQDTATLLFIGEDLPARREQEVNAYLDALDDREFQAILSRK